MLKVMGSNPGYNLKSTLSGPISHGAGCTTKNYLPSHFLQADATTLDFERQLKDFLLEFGETKVESEGFSFFIAVARGYVDVAVDEFYGGLFSESIFILVISLKK